MAILNEEIVSELNAIPDSDEKMRILLKWLVEFERDNSDKARFSYKSEILSQLDLIFKSSKD